MPRVRPTLESLRARYETTRSPGDAYRARALAKRLGVDPPDWAMVGKPRRDRLNLEALRQRHDRGGTPDRLARLRQLARQRATAAGVEVPAWAATDRQRPTAPAPAKAAEKQPPSEPTADRSPAARQPPAFKRSGRPKGKPLTVVRPSAVVVASRPAVEVPAELRAWRARAVGAVVQIDQRSGAVTLHELGADPRRFASVNEAIAAVA